MAKITKKRMLVYTSWGVYTTYSKRPFLIIKGGKRKMMIDKEIENGKVLVYVRVSTDEQMQKGFSIDSQIDACKKRAIELGYKEKDVHVISDGMSGGDLDRPGLSKLRDIIQTDEKPEIVIMYEPDRFSRNLTNQLVLTDEIVNKGIQLEFIDFEWKNTPEGRMFYQLRGMFAEYERAKLKERTIRGRMQKIKKHGKLSNNPRIFGYDFDTEHDVLVTNEAEAKIAKFIFEMAADGTSGEEIARRLAEANIPAPRGTNWYGATVTRILHNETYLGTFWAYKTDYHQGFRRERPKEEQFPIPVEQLVDEETFQKAKDTLKKNRTNVGRPSKRDYLVSGLGRCFCGRSVVASVRSGNREYTYYSCVGKHKTKYNSITGKKEMACQSHYWNSTVVDAVIWEKVKEVIANPKDMLQEFVEHEKNNNDLNSKFETELSLLQAQEKQTQTKKDKLLDLYLTEGIDREQYENKMATLNEELDRILHRIGDIADQQQDNSITKKEMNKQVSYLRTYQHALEAAGFTKRKEIVDTLVKKIVFNQNREVSIVFNIGEPYP